MAIKNNQALIGGTDWISGESLANETKYGGVGKDLNDTFDKFYNIFQWQ